MESGFGPEFTLGPAFGRTRGGRPGMTERTYDSRILEVWMLAGVSVRH
jgi:hypothetical protein